MSTFNNQPAQRDVLYWEHEGNKAVRRGKWKLVCKYPGDWELYDIEADRTERNDLAASHPTVVSELTALYEAWATRCQVMPWEELLQHRAQLPGGGLHDAVTDANEQSNTTV